MARPERDAIEERRSVDFSVNAVLWTAAGTAGFLLVSLAGLWVFWKADEGPRAFPPPRSYGPPALQSDPAGDLADYLAKQQAALEGYAWVDRDRGLARIPIERAMEILAARGEAAWDPLQPAPPAAEAARR
jgi:hypothetical protein